MGYCNRKAPEIYKCNLGLEILEPNLVKFIAIQIY